MEVKDASARQRKKKPSRERVNLIDFFYFPSFPTFSHFPPACLPARFLAFQGVACTVMIHFHTIGSSCFRARICFVRSFAIGPCFQRLRAASKYVGSGSCISPDNAANLVSWPIWFLDRLACQFRQTVRACHCLAN